MNAQDESDGRGPAGSRPIDLPEYAGFLAGLHRELERPLGYVRRRLDDAIGGGPLTDEQRDQLRTMVGLCDELALDLKDHLLGPRPSSPGPSPPAGGA